MRSAIPSGCVLGVLIVAGVAGASTPGELSLRALARQSEQVFVGTARQVQYQRDPRSGMVFTHVTFGELRWLKGPSRRPDGPEGLRLRVAGGRDHDGSYLKVSGVPTFHTGERYVVFQRARGATFAPIAGGDQGCFRLALDRRRGIRVVLDARNRPVLAVREGRIERPRPAASEERTSLFGAAVPGAGGASHVEAGEPAGSFRDPGISPTLTRYVGTAARRAATPAASDALLSRAMPAATFLGSVRAALRP